MKKLMAIVISMAMVLAMMPMGVFATGEKYITLPAASEDGVIKLTQNIEISDAEVLDLTGKTITTDGYNFVIKEGGSLIVKGQGTVKSEKVATKKNEIFKTFMVEEGGSLIINGGTFTTKTAQFIVSRGTVNVTGGSFSAEYNTENDYTDSNCAFVITGENSILNMTGGTINAGNGADDCGLYGIYASNGAVVNLGDAETEGPTVISYCAPLGCNHDTATGTYNVYNGTYESTWTGGNTNYNYFHGAIYAACKGAVKIEGGTFKGEYGVAIPYDNVGLKLTISGGDFTQLTKDTINESHKTVSGDNETNTTLITGGTFSSDPSAYLADNHIVWAEDGKYEVETFDAYRAGVVLAPLADTDNNISKEDLKAGYSIDYTGENITINVKPQLHANGAEPAVTGKWIGIAVPVPAGATKINWTVNGTSIGEDNCTGDNIDWTNDGVNYETLYWNYATKDITSIGYKFNNVGGTNTVKIAVNAAPTTVIEAPLHDNAATNPIADNALYSKYDIAYVDDTATITVKGLKAHTNGVGSVGKWVGIAVPADYSNADTKLIYKYGDGEVKEADLTDEIWTKDGKKYVSFYMDINSKKSETISYTFGTSKDNAKGFNTVKVNIVEESEYTGGGAAVVPPATDNVTNNPADKNTTADIAPAVKDNKAETTVDAKTADKIVDKAVENNSTEVVIDAAGNNSVASSEVAIPEKAVKELAEKTDANLVIKTDNGQVDLDKAALAAVAEQAGTAGTVTLVVETVKKDENICHVDLKLVTSNGAVKDFKGGNVKVTITLTKELAAKELVCVYIDDNDIYTLVEGVLNADGTYTFTTGHFSEYAVMAKADADKVIADQLKTMIKDVNLKVRTSKTSKKNIKAVVSGDVKALTDAGYTVKYKFYRSTKKASKYAVLKTKADNTYINTKGKKGTKYYYKAKALVYQGDKLVGQTVLTQCKYGVRTWSK